MPQNKFPEDRYRHRSTSPSTGTNRRSGNRVTVGQSSNERASANSYSERKGGARRSERTAYSSRTSNAQNVRSSSSDARRTDPARPRKNSSINNSEHRRSRQAPKDATWLSVVKKIFRAIGGFFANLFRGFVYIWTKTKVGGVLVTLVLVAAIGFGVDAIVNKEKIYAGITIGNVNVSGMTKEEAVEAVNSVYENNLFATKAYIFSNERDADSADIERHMIQQEAIAEQISFEEAQKNKSLWVTCAEDLSASLPSHALVDEAFEFGRNWSILDRVSALLMGHNIKTYIDYDQVEMERLLSDIDKTIGKERIDCGIEFKNGMASITRGQDGEMVNRSTFTNSLTEALLANDEERATIVARVEHTPIRITEKEAAYTAEAINNAIANGATFTFDNSKIDLDNKTLASWVTTSIEENDGKYFLSPQFDRSIGVSQLVKYVNEEASGMNVNVDFTNENGNVMVYLQDEIMLPNTREALNKLDQLLFDAYRNTKEPAKAARPNVKIESSAQSGPFSIDEAMTYGIVTNIGDYTTTFTAATSTKNRNHNIRLVADTINNSIIEGGGAKWSFNNTVGDTTAEDGYLDAGIIDNDEYTTGVGGGVCQVVTTIFNAVYNAGLPVDERHNHTLYIASYPAGRDAAVSYPYMDFVFTNDLSSDVLMRTSYTESSITVALYSVATGRNVSTETGKWEEGEKYKTIVEVDENLPDGFSQVKTVGTDGSVIWVIRTVTDENGNYINSDRFDSVYSPVNEVIQAGPNTEVKKRQDQPEEEKNDKSSEEKQTQ